MVLADRSAPGPELALAIALLTLPWTAGAGAHEASRTSDDHGAITWHDDPEGPPTRAAHCQFWAHGTGVSQPNGTIVAVHDHPPRGSHEHTLATWEAHGEGSDGYRFTAGPLTLHTSGPATVTAEVADGHRTSPDPVLYTGCPDEPEVPSLPGLPICMAGTLGPGDVDLPVIFC